MHYTSLCVATPDSFASHQLLLYTVKVQIELRLKNSDGLRVLVLSVIWSVYTVRFTKRCSDHPTLPLPFAMGRVAPFIIICYSTSSIYSICSTLLLHDWCDRVSVPWRAKGLSVLMRELQSTISISDGLATVHQMAT